MVLEQVVHVGHFTI